MLPVVIGIAAVGLLLLGVGLRGRRVGDEPRCRRCGFEVTGLREGAACPECNAALGVRGAVRAGVRRRRVGLVVCGSVLLLGGGAAGLVELGSLDLNHRKPVWLLTLEVRNRAEAAAMAAMDEVAARDARGELSRDEVRRAVEAVLTLQRRGFQRWDTEHAGVLMRAAVRGEVTEEQWGRFVEGAVDLEIHGFRRWPVDRPLVLSVSITSRRDAASPFGGAPELTMAHLRHVLTLETFEVDGIAVRPEYDADRFDYRQRATIGTVFYGPAEGVEPGTRTLRAVLRFDLVHDDALPSERKARTDDTARLRQLPVIRSWRWEGTRTIEALPPGDPPVVLVDDAETASRLREGLVIRDLSWQWSGRFLVRNGEHILRQGLRLTLDVPMCELGLSFAVSLRPRTDPAGNPVLNADELPIGSLVYGPRPSLRHSLAQLVLPAGIDQTAIGTADLIFRTDPSHAGQNPDIEAVWDGEIVYRDVPVSATGRTSFPHHDPIGWWPARVE